MSSTPSTTLLVSLLSLLPIPQPPTSLILPIHPQTPAVSKQKTRDILLRILSVHLGELDDPANETCPRLRLLCPHDYPTPSQEKAFVGIAASYLTEFRREIMSSNGLDKAWWTELKVGIRKSDLSEAAGPRYEQILLALACQTVYWDLLKTLKSRPKLSAACVLNFSCEAQTKRIEDLFKGLKQALNDIHVIQKEPMQRIKRLEQRRENVSKIEASMIKPGISKNKQKISSEDLLTALDAKIFEWDDLVRQWFEMDGTMHPENPSRLLDLALVEKALNNVHGEFHPTDKQKEAVKSSSTQENTVKFDGLEASFPRIVSVVSEELLSASDFLSKISSRLVLGPTILDEDEDFMTNRVLDQTIITPTTANLPKDIPAPGTLRLKSRAAKISISTPRRLKKLTRASYTSLRKTSTNELRFLNLWGLDKTSGTTSSTISRKSDPYNHLIEHVNRTSIPTCSSERNSRIQNALREN